MESTFNATERYEHGDTEYWTLTRLNFVFRVAYVPMVIIGIVGNALIIKIMPNRGASMNSTGVLFSILAVIDSYVICLGPLRSALNLISNYESMDTAVKTMMMKVALILSAVVVAATATPFLQLGDDETLGDVDVEISVRGGQKTLTYRTPTGNVLDVTHVLKSEGVIVNIPGDQETSDDEDEDEDRSTCKEREPMTDEAVPPRITEICRGKAVSPELVEALAAGQLAAAVMEAYAVESNVHGLSKGSCAQVLESLTYCLVQP
ncbi:hypothetical protein MAR_031673 [Mya arenaria]|uniref:G-protein coupled receptors family 1 profile domain-containing protein n=1 Tax=Mya arenaria TaxID=6604 RepID=A0ABY7F7D6_MYAAR|nr:hypothetical protein MAR_031673 [Mya arenaria]